jgi:hypothetical protein
MLPIWENAVHHEYYRLERAGYVCRKASGDEGAASTFEDIGQERQMEFAAALPLAQLPGVIDIGM